MNGPTSTDAGDPTDPAIGVLGRAIRDFLSARDHHLREILPGLGLSHREFITLNHLYYEGGCTPGQLARELVLTPGTVTVLTDRLIAAELVQRTRHPDDRRRQLITLTDAGRQHIHDALTRFYQATSAAASGTTGLDYQTTATFLANLTEIVRTEGPGPQVEWPTSRTVLPEHRSTE